MHRHIMEIKALVDQLRSLDTDFRVFGADSHRYRVGPTLSESTIEDFETKHDINLPPDYRLYLQLVGDGRGLPTPQGFCPKGGAGPSYGPYSLLEMHVGHRINQPFPLKSKVELPEESPYNKWSDDIPGALEISTRGCASHTHLIVKGPQYGTIWEGWEYKNFAPAHESFSVWMTTWAEEEISAWNYKHLAERIQVGMSRAQVVATTTDDWEERTVGDQILFESILLRTQLFLDTNGFVIKIKPYFWG